MMEMRRAGYGGDQAALMRQQEAQRQQELLQEAQRQSQLGRLILERNAAQLQKQQQEAQRMAQARAQAASGAF